MSGPEHRGSGSAPHGRGEETTARRHGGGTTAHDHGGGAPPHAHRASHGPAASASAAPRPYRALAVTASNRAAAGVYEDKGGPLLVAGLETMGFAVDGPRVVPDGEPVREVLREAVAAGYAVVLTTGGTGISPTDRTPEMTRSVLEREIPGIPEAIRAEGAAKVATAALSRGVAGVAGRTLVVNLPGSTGGVKDGMAVLARLLPHAVDQIHGGDHPAEPDRPAEPVSPRRSGGHRGDDAR
ncbi:MULTISPECIES: MogA/MoaB family molybdenum cofactor biosynthesis protein [Streptomyces]|uniref:MogA/MoaB family molybdenum cofactor biosynthesis protein n=1 Tax=Streptomyces TaxID=1883 RepID=UPI00099FD066|nr:MogA/MoaB family molybdenum cofactor biosynthesis protein [Streptomyces qinglanensis]